MVLKKHAEGTVDSEKIERRVSGEKKDARNNRNYNEGQKLTIQIRGECLKERRARASNDNRNTSGIWISYKKQIKLNRSCWISWYVFVVDSVREKGCWYMKCSSRRLFVEEFKVTLAEVMQEEIRRGSFSGEIYRRKVNLQTYILPR